MVYSNWIRTGHRWLPLTRRRYPSDLVRMGVTGDRCGSRQSVDGPVADKTAPVQGAVRLGVGTRHSRKNQVFPTHSDRQARSRNREADTVPGRRVPGKPNRFDSRFVPVLGYLDDVVIVVGALALIVKLTPGGLIHVLIDKAKSGPVGN